MTLYRLPSYSPSLQIIEHFWEVLRYRATHNRLFEIIAQLKQALRNSLCYYQTLKPRMLPLIQSAKTRQSYLRLDQSGMKGSCRSPQFAREFAL